MTGVLGGVLALDQALNVSATDPEPSADFYLWEITKNDSRCVVGNRQQLSYVGDRAERFLRFHEAHFSFPGSLSVLVLVLKLRLKVLLMRARSPGAYAILWRSIIMP
jgi:hypothetical protein